VDFSVALTALALIVPVELPDKTFVATLVLATRYRPLLVWIGVGLAFTVQTAVAVTAGGLLTRLPHRPVVAVAGAAVPGRRHRAAAGRRQRGRRGGRG
jgi:putative Ca2+/H+ antiporter (TMEM165/GDT1 family)